MLVTPGPIAVTTPVALTVATPEPPTDHVPPAGEAVNVMEEPPQIAEAPDIVGAAFTVTRCSPRHVVEVPSV